MIAKERKNETRAEDAIDIYFRKYHSYCFYLLWIS